SSDGSARTPTDRVCAVLPRPGSPGPVRHRRSRGGAEPVGGPPVADSDIYDEDYDWMDDLYEGDWAGQCYTAALRWARVADEPDWVIVHGTVLSAAAGKRIAHAWCERGECVVDLALPAGEREVAREQYYRVLQPEVHFVYTRREAMRLVFM